MVSPNRTKKKNCPVQVKHGDDQFAGASARSTPSSAIPTSAHAVSNVSTNPKEHISSTMAPTDTDAKNDSLSLETGFDMGGKDYEDDLYVDEYSIYDDDKSWFSYGSKHTTSVMTGNHPPDQRNQLTFHVRWDMIAVLLSN
ncbi:hypothetical protein ACA910_018045 [Epithemia clementina (nom. ined.)]